jgi:hypothetical protein
MIICLYISEARRRAVAVGSPERGVTFDFWRLVEALGAGHLTDDSVMTRSTQSSPHFFTHHDRHMTASSYRAVVCARTVRRTQ